MAIPGKPLPVTFQEVGKTSLVAKINDGVTNGTIINRLVIISRATIRDGPNAYIHVVSPPNTARRFAGLVTGERYYFWSRIQNSDGWSDYSDISSILVAMVPQAPTSPSLSMVTQTSLRAEFADNDNGGVPILERQLAWGTNPPPASPTFTRVYTAPNEDITNLVPGQTYYFQSRVRNEVGWSSYSAPQVMTMVAGARVLRNGTWERAVPYVRVGGVWKLARPWVKNAGIWKETPT